MAAQEKRNQEWTGSFKKPWMNPRMNYQLGGHAFWRFVLTVIAPLLIAVVFVLFLVHDGVLSENWGRVVTTAAIVVAGSAFVMTVSRTTRTPHDNRH